jgi:hypothetical protein
VQNQGLSGDAGMKRAAAKPTLRARDRSVYPAHD